MTWPAMTGFIVENEIVTFKVDCERYAAEGSAGEKARGGGANCTHLRVLRAYEGR